MVDYFHVDKRRQCVYSHPAFPFLIILWNIKLKSQAFPTYLTHFAVHPQPPSLKTNILITYLSVDQPPS